ncbi:MAG: hypothetical protein KDH09_10900 [Chrysiogenetes bacterium]|nr:hypothetical protein [Chrysiogenetes bacterium]
MSEGIEKRETYEIEFLYRPGQSHDELQLQRLVAELRDVAATCFSEIPDYQCLAGTRAELADKVITIARRSDGTAAGFCSAALLPVDKVGDVFHLGLTCVRPEDRSAGLTHKLTSRVVIQYLVKYKPLSKVWVSNVACVLSSLGNVALNFEEVYPSPYFAKNQPSRNHERIALSINSLYRDKIYIRGDAKFDTKKFVFRGSVQDTCFQKAQNDTRFHHRDVRLNDYYSDLMSWSAGDEILQIGSVSLLTGVKYYFKKLAQQLPGRSRLAGSRRPAGEGASEAA